ncbi:MAG TPA: DUF1801 domain-containing protein [Flavisolibacter sp.]|nr:DUF1801 domain-containing protein [Flavisolibacter sp.]
MNKAATTVDQYIERFPTEIQTRLQALRKTIRQAAPEAEESISYGMPAYNYFGALVYFAGYKGHIGFYPVPTAMKEFENDLAPYAAAKGTAQFRHDKPIPFELVTRIVKFRMEENRQKTEKKKQARKCKNGHAYFKTSDCPTCPVCEAENKPTTGFLSTLSAPARRALESNGITSVKKLAALSEVQVLALHGVGPSSLPKLKKALQAEGLQFQ